MTRSDVARFLSFRPFTGAHMALVIVTFFGVVIAVNLYMATMAAKSWTGLIAKNGYVASALMKERAEREAGAVAAGWTIAATVEGDRVRVSTRDGSGAPIERARVSAVAERPVNENEDRAMPLDKLGAGLYRTAEPLPTGRWYLDVMVRADDLELTRRFSFVVDD